MDWKTKISVDFQAFKILHSHWRFHSQAENKIIFVILRFFILILKDIEKFRPIYSMG